MQLAIQAENLVKYYGNVKALDQVSLNVYKGEIFGFLGPNGAGKSTFVKILLNLTAPSGGKAKIFGESSRHVLSRKSVGFLPENIKTYQFLTVEEFLSFHAELSELSRKSIKSEVDRCLAIVGLAKDRKKRISALSKGMLQRAGIAQALLGNPELLILDEPTSGLDPIGFTELRKMLLDMKQQGTTIFLNSHLLSEIERTCDRVAILYKGRILKSGNKADLSDKEKHLEIIVDGLNDSMVREINLISKKPLEIDGSSVRVYPEKEEDTFTIHRILAEQGGRLQALSWKAESLEELFYRLVKHENLDDNKNRN